MLTSRSGNIGGHPEHGQVINRHSYKVGKDGYEYQYDYENRIVKITKDNNDVAEFAYDALGRRIKKYDAVANETTLYYNNYNWQVLCEYNDSNVPQRVFIYGNYIDEVLVMNTPALLFYVHDHLYSPVALVFGGSVLERYEYDAYGNPTIYTDDGGDGDWWNGNETISDSSDYGNPYLFTGRRVDILDNGSLKIQYSRNRYYDYYAGRWFSHDPLGYVDGMNLYEYVGSQPLSSVDPYGGTAFGLSLFPPWLKPWIDHLPDFIGPEPHIFPPSRPVWVWRLVKTYRLVLYSCTSGTLPGEPCKPGGKTTISIYDNPITKISTDKFKTIFGQYKVINIERYKDFKRVTYKCNKNCKWEPWHTLNHGSHLCDITSEKYKRVQRSAPAPRPPLWI